MKKIKEIKKSELDFDITKIKEIDRLDVFENRIEITFLLEE